MLSGPTTEAALYVWVFGLMLAYLCVRYASYYIRTSKLCEPGPAVFDAGSFAISCMLLWGVLDPSVLTAIGSTKPLLLIAGFFGVLYALHALVPR